MYVRCIYLYKGCIHNMIDTAYPYKYNVMIVLSTHLTVLLRVLKRLHHLLQLAIQNHHATVVQGDRDKLPPGGDRRGLGLGRQREGGDHVPPPKVPETHRLVVAARYVLALGRVRCEAPELTGEVPLAKHERGTER